MMKKISLLFLSLSLYVSTNAQEFDNWSLDLGFGMHRIGAPITEGYSAKVLGQGNLGVRYMFNEKFGLRLDLGYNKFDADGNSLPFSSNFYRGTVEGIVNLGNILEFNSWTKKFNLLAHGGLGGSILNITEPDVSGNIFMATLNLGITPQFKLSERIAIFADFSSLINFGQERNFDGGSNTSSRESNISLFNTSLGLNISFGKYRRLADFYFDEQTPLESELDKIKKRLASAEKELAELKLSEASPDKELIMTELDERYVKKDEVNKYADVITGGNVQFVKELLNRGYINVFFDVNKAEIKDGSLNSIIYLKQFMIDNPTVTATLIGYADETGTDERNEKLSLKRAKMVNNILVSAGINPTRLSYLGAGVDRSVSKDGRQFARRVTFKIN